MGETVVGGAVVATVVTGTVLVVDVEVVVEVVEVVVVVAGGITKPFAQPHLMSIGAPKGKPTVVGWASRYRRSCAQPSHAEIPVVGQPPAPASMPRSAR